LGIQTLILTAVLALLQYKPEITISPNVNAQIKMTTVNEVEHMDSSRLQK
jgi:hypothetical protein